MWGGTTGPRTRCPRGTRRPRTSCPGGHLILRPHIRGDIFTGGHPVLWHPVRPCHTGRNNLGMRLESDLKLYFVNDTCDGSDNKWNITGKVKMYTIQNVRGTSFCRLAFHKIFVEVNLQINNSGRADCHSCSMLCSAALLSSDNCSKNLK